MAVPQNGPKVDAIMLAGARNDGPLAGESEAEWEALIEVGGRPMAARVLEALRDSGRVARVAVVGPKEELAVLGYSLLKEDAALPADSPKERSGAEAGPAREEPFQVTFPGDAGSLLDNLQLGVASLASDRAVLIVTCDIPLLTPEAVRDFLAACERTPAEIHYPIIRREDSEARYPGVTRTYVRLRDGEFTGGNMALLAPRVLTRHRAVFERAVAMRKNPVALARLFGLGLLVKMLLGRLRVRDVEARLHKSFGVQAVAVPCSHPEVGLDVDKPGDLALVRQLWQSGSAP